MSDHKNVFQSGVISVGLSDHILIYCTRKITKVKTYIHKTVRVRSLKNYTKEWAKNTHGGGIVCYVNYNIPHRIRYDCSHNENDIESIAIQLKFSNECLYNIKYRPPNVHIHHLNTTLEFIMGKCLCESSSILYNRRSQCKCTKSSQST